MNTKKLFILLVLPLIGMGVYASVVWNLNPGESYVQFTARNAFGKVHGKIPGINGEIKFDESDLEHSGFKTWIGPNDINTENKKRDKHLRSEDFLDVVKFPRISFESKKIEKTEKGFNVSGALTIKEVTKDVQIPFTFAQEAGGKSVFKGSFSINRLDYGIGKPTKLAGNIIDIEITAVAQK